VFYGSNDQRTNDYLSRQLGQTTVHQDVTRLSGKRFAWMATQQSTMPQDIGRALRFPDELRLLQDDQEFVLIQGVRPILAQKFITPNKVLRMSGEANGDKN
jgi:type IV secretory pathway TraG/TraD family ATPase VirD4